MVLAEVGGEGEFLV